nr:uncharacterized protein LOC117689351 [Crassostrea gigas]
MLQKLENILTFNISWEQCLTTKLLGHTWFLNFVNLASSTLGYNNKRIKRMKKHRNSFAEYATELLHLESRKLVHRRLAARNVLLTSELEPKIYGFCPKQKEAEGENKDDDGDLSFHIQSMHKISCFVYKCCEN